MQGSHQEIVVVEFVHAIKGKTNELRHALAALVPICQKGEGCLQYQLFEPIQGSGEFLVLMRWKDLKDLKRHEASKPIQEFVQKYDRVLYGDVSQTEWKVVAH